MTSGLQPERRLADIEGVRHHRLAGIALSLGLLAATTGLAAQAIRVTALDPQRVEDGASELLESGAIRDSVRDRIVDAVSRQAGAPFTDRTTLETAANEALEDPEVERAFEQGIGEVSRRMFEGNIETPVVLDSAPLTRAVKEALMRRDQRFGLWLPDGSLMVTIPTDDLPDLTSATSFIETAAGVGLFAALLLIGGAVAFHDHRPWAVGRIGRWMFGFGGIAVVMTAILPRFVLPEFGDPGEIAGAVVAGTGAPLVWPAATLACHRFRNAVLRRALDPLCGRTADAGLLRSVHRSTQHDRAQISDASQRPGTQASKVRRRVPQTCCRRLTFRPHTQSVRGRRKPNLPARSGISDHVTFARQEPQTRCQPSPSTYVRTDTRRIAHCDASVGNRSRHNRTRSDHNMSADCRAGQDDRTVTEPRVRADRDGLRRTELQSDRRIDVFISVVGIGDIDVMSRPDVVTDLDGKMAHDAASLSDNGPVTDRDDRAVLRNVTRGYSGRQARVRTDDRARSDPNMWLAEERGKRETDRASNSERTELPGTSAVRADRGATRALVPRRKHGVAEPVTGAVGKRREGLHRRSVIRPVGGHRVDDSRPR